MDKEMQETNLPQNLIKLGIPQEIWDLSGHFPAKII
jgi:hypothetical protein